MNKYQNNILKSIPFKFRQNKNTDEILKYLKKQVLILRLLSFIYFLLIVMYSYSIYELNQVSNNLISEQMFWLKAILIFLFFTTIIFQFRRASEIEQIQLKDIQTIL